MNIIFFFLISISIITVCFHGCKSSVEKPKQALKKQSVIVQHFYGKNKDARLNYFTSPIGTTDDNIVFKADGKVNIQLGKSSQTFDITKLHQQKRLIDIKKIVQ